MFKTTKNLKKKLSEKKFKNEKKLLKSWNIFKKILRKFPKREEEDDDDGDDDDEGADDDDASSFSLSVYANSPSTEVS